MNSTWYPEIEEPIKCCENHYTLVLYKRIRDNILSDPTRCKMITLPNLTTPLTHFSFKMLGECTWRDSPHLEQRGGLLASRWSRVLDIRRENQQNQHNMRLPTSLFTEVAWTSNYTQNHRSDAYTAYAKSRTQTIPEGNNHGRHASSVNRSMNPVVKMPLECVICFSISFRCYALSLFCT